MKDFVDRFRRLAPYHNAHLDGTSRLQFTRDPRAGAAIAGYQRDQGLYITSAIDESTLASLGMV